MKGLTFKIVFKLGLLDAFVVVYFILKQFFGVDWLLLLLGYGILFAELLFLGSNLFFSSWCLGLVGRDFLSFFFPIIESDLLFLCHHLLI